MKKKSLRHVFEYIIFLLLTNFLKLFSVDRSASICSFISRKIGPYLGVSDIARRNLKKIYGKEIDIDKTIDKLWDNYGRYIGEFPFINSMNEEELKERVIITGLNHIQNFQKREQPFMLFLGHQANWDFMIRRINDLYPKFGIVYRKANNPYVDQRILSERRANDPDITMIAKGPSGVKDLVRSIKSKSSVAMLVDQKMNDGIDVPFFGKPAMTAPAIARLSLQYDYPIVPLQLIRLGSTSYFEMKVHPPIQYKKTGDKKKDCYNIMLIINRKLEDWIREKPAQWFWFHNRWK
ncbi:lipid A biosynthesis lauroyl acyltransferase [Rickettsiaceae bacterium]|nr:lipid A biosynthesis lauroyl acyltransferase [Rickettsiaceae bacterium]